MVLTAFHGRLVQRVAGTAAAAGRQREQAEAHFLDGCRRISVDVLRGYVEQLRCDDVRNPGELAA
jgi:hypothetical protein